MGLYDIELVYIESDWEDYQSGETQLVQWKISKHDNLYKLHVEHTNIDVFGREWGNQIVFKKYQNFDDKVDGCDDYNKLAIYLSPGPYDLSIEGNGESELHQCSPTEEKYYKEKVKINGELR